MYGFLIIVALLCEILAAASYRRRPPSVSKLKYFSKSRKLSDTNFLVEFEIEPHANLGIVTTESHEIIDFHSHHDGFVGIAGDSGHLKIGDVLVAINGVNIEKKSAAEASRVFKAVSRVEPGQNSVKLDLAFRRPATTTTTTSTDTKRLVKKEDDAECHLHLFFSHQDAVKTHETYSKQEHREVPVLMPAKLAEFGMRPEGRLPRAKIVIADHAFGCQPYSSKPSKNEREIVLVRRGQCSYHEKTLHASRAGFMALLVWNDKDETVEMHSSEDNNVDNIAVAMVSYSVGRKIANMITRSHLDVVLNYYLGKNTDTMMDPIESADKGANMTWRAGYSIWSILLLAYLMINVLKPIRRRIAARTEAENLRKRLNQGTENSSGVESTKVPDNEQPVLN